MTAARRPTCPAAGTIRAGFHWDASVGFWNSKRHGAPPRAGYTPWLHSTAQTLTVEFSHRFQDILDTSEPLRMIMVGPGVRARLKNCKTARP